MVKYLDLAIANDTINTTDIKGKDYAEVNQRIKAYRMVYPTGTISTTMISNDNGVCIFKASVYDEKDNLLGTGTAYEKENSSFINKTSYIENCETSAVGRALGMAGFGIDVSIASAEEVANAIKNQEVTQEEAEEYKITYGKHKGKTIKEIYEIDKQYIEWILGNSNDERIHKIIELTTGIKIPTEEEQTERLILLDEVNHLIAEKNIDLEKLKKKFGVDSTKDFNTNMLKDLKAYLENK